MNNCSFFRLLKEDEKGSHLAGIVKSIRNNQEKYSAFLIETTRFRKVPGSPFAYWISEKIRDIFHDYPKFDSNGVTAKGLSTSDDFRFIRTWWEVNPHAILSGTEETTQEQFVDQTYHGKTWVPCTKGGDYSPYYADIHLVANWKENGQEMKSWVVENPNDPGTTHWSRNIRSPELYFNPGLTWTHRTTSPIGFRILNRGCIIGVKGPAAFYPNTIPMLGVMQSNTFKFLLNMRLGAADAAARSYDINLLLNTPVPNSIKPYENQLFSFVSTIIVNKRRLENHNEQSHLFAYPLLNGCNDHPLFDQCTAFSNNVKKTENQIKKCQKTIDDVAYDLYNISYNDRKAIEDAAANNPSIIGSVDIEPTPLVASLISYILGTIFGRWDIRYATGEKEPPELPDPFAPLLACSPGMLQGEDGLPLEPHEIPADYPLAVDGDGILVDDEGHPDDIIARIRDVLTIIWGDRADAIEKEACEILGMKSLRDYFRKPTAGGFWDDHVKRYSKSRRKAPIYWLLQSAKKNYAIWIYYPRMDGDTLYKALRYAKDKLAMEERRFEDMKGELSQLGTGGAAVKRLEKEIDGQEAFISELHEFVEKMERAANLDLIPEHDDGVVLTIAPLHELVTWKEPKKYWDELTDGKYEWSSIGKQLREKGMVKG